MVVQAFVQQVPPGASWQNAILVELVVPLADVSCVEELMVAPTAIPCVEQTSSLEGGACVVVAVTVVREGQEDELADVPRVEQAS